jgi:fumarate hydratase class II
MPDIRKETDGLGVVEVPSDKLWIVQTQRSLKLTVRRKVEK